MATKSKFAAPHFNDETAARQWFEAARWPRGAVCPHCGSFKHYVTKKDGEPTGRYRCGEKECRKDFTVMTGTVMERSHAPLTKWAAAFHLAASSKKGISAAQFERELGVEYNTAWFMWHRIREAMGRGGLEVPPLGGKGKHIEADETYFGNRPGAKVRRGTGHKRVVVSLVERGGHIRSFHVNTADIPTVKRIIDRHVDKASTLNTDEAAMYKPVGKEFAAHQVVHHGHDEYARGSAYTNTLEGFFSIFKRGMRGVYQHCDEKHLHRYLAEFDFRYNHRASLGYSDDDRAVAAVKGGEGKRLTYRQPH